MSTTSSYPLVLGGLTTREQIHDVLIRVCLGLDINDRAMWESAWDLSAPAELVVDVGGNVSRGLEAVNKEVFEHVGPMATQHLLTNVRIDVQDGATAAHATAQALNQHIPAGKGLVLGSDHLLAGSLYDMRLVKDASGQWKLRTWKLNLLWVQGSWSVLKGETNK